MGRNSSCRQSALSTSNKMYIYLSQTFVQDGNKYLIYSTIEANPGLIDTSAAKRPESINFKKSRIGTPFAVVGYGNLPFFDYH